MDEIKKILTKNGVSCIFILGIVLFGLLQFLLPDQSMSTIENRSLQQVPQFRVESLADGSYQKEYADYLSDQFPMRGTLVQVHTNFEHEIGKYEINGIIIGEDDELFQESVIPTKIMMDQKISCINQFATNYPDINISMLLVPNKASILSKKLPPSRKDQNQIPTLKSFQKGLDEQIHFIDSVPTLLKHKDEYIYYRNDHHWTSKGAYIAFENWKNQMQADAPLLTYDKHTLHDDFYGTLANTSGYYQGKSDQIELYTSKGDPLYYVQFTQSKKSKSSLYDASKINTSNPYDVFLSGNQPLIDISTTVENAKHLLVIKDSYANSFIQFLLPYYSKITIVDPRYYYDDIEQLIQDRAITDTLFLYNSNTFFSDTALQNLFADIGE